MDKDEDGVLAKLELHIVQGIINISKKLPDRWACDCDAQLRC